MPRRLQVPPACLQNNNKEPSAPNGTDCQADPNTGPPNRKHNEVQANNATISSRAMHTPTQVHTTYTKASHKQCIGPH
eukprot:5913086-Amphidinium_carterae.1